MNFHSSRLTIFLGVVTLHDLRLRGWHREAMPAFCTVCSHTNPFLVMKYLQHTREYAHINHLVWPSQKLCGSDFIILHFSQMRKPWPTDVVRHAQVYLVHNWSVWGLTDVSLTQTFVKPLYCVVLPLPCQGPLSFRKDIPQRDHQFSMNSMPIHFRALLFGKWSHGLEELIESCLGWQRDLRDPEFRMYIGLGVQILT